MLAVGRRRWSARSSLASASRALRAQLVELLLVRCGAAWSASSSRSMYSGFAVSFACVDPCARARRAPAARSASGTNRWRCARRNARVSASSPSTRSTRSATAARERPRAHLAAVAAARACGVGASITTSTVSLALTRASSLRRSAPRARPAAAGTRSPRTAAGGTRSGRSRPRGRPRAAAMIGARASSARRRNVGPADRAHGRTNGASLARRRATSHYETGCARFARRPALGPDHR